MNARRTFLVFEAGQAHAPAPPAHYAATGTDPARLHPFQCVGGVAAPTEEEAVRAVIGVTRRVSRYAVVEATFIDFTAAIGDDPQGERVQLNP